MQDVHLRQLYEVVHLLYYLEYSTEHHVLEAVHMTQHDLHVLPNALVMTHHVTVIGHQPLF